MHRHPFLQCLVILLAGLACLLLHPALAASGIPLHRISLSFQIEASLVNGTSKIVIPADTPLRLDCGLLRLTGVVLEQHGKTPQVLKIADNNSLAIAPAKEEQTLSLSWQLQATANGESDNLVRTDGITLAGAWHPVADRDMLFSLEAALPKNFEAISEADIITTKGTPSGRQVASSFSQPLRSLHFIAGPYVVRSQQRIDSTLSTYFFKEDAAIAGEYLKKTTDLIDRYKKLIGPFPFKRFAIVENRLPTGYGLPTFTLLGQSVIRLPFIKERSLGHEILHSWFGNSVLTSDSGGNWSEGLTTYLADQSFAADTNQGPVFRKSQLIRYQAYVHPTNSIPLNAFYNTADNQPLSRVIRSVGYDKGSMVFHMLRQHIGEMAFSAGLQHFYRQMRGQRASWQDLEAAFAHSSGKDLRPFFHQWLERTDIPAITIENTKIDQRKGRAVLTFDLVQDSPTPFLLDIPIQITTIRGKTVKTLHTDTARKSISLELESLPTELILDGDYDLMRRLHPEELQPTWSQFLGAEQKTVIAPTAALSSNYQALIEALRLAGCRIVAPAAVNNSMLTHGSWLFLGDSPLRRSLFAEPESITEGFTLDARRSPLNKEEMMVLVDSASEHETSKIVAKLDHYGSFSRLRFLNGNNIEKTTAASTGGIVFPLIDTPQGIPTRAILNFEQIIDDLAQNRVVYVGEIHTEYGSHQLQLQILQALNAHNRPLVIGLEMFPRSSQQALDNFVQGKTDEREFLKASRYFEVWGYDYRLYRDLIAYARAKKIPLVGLNLDKEITGQIFTKGSTDGLTSEQQKQIAQERQLDVPGYQQRLQEVYGHHDSSHGSGFSGFLQAQALWDETMAESVVKTLQNRYSGHQMLVLAGNGHVAKDSGIPPRVERRIPGIRQRVVTVANNMEMGGEQADYLMFAQPIELMPAAKLGVVCGEDSHEGQPGRLRISSISPQGRAGQAGLAAGDRILTLDGQPLSSITDLRISLLDKKAGDQVQLEILRGRERLTVSVQLSTVETEIALPPGHPKK